MYNSMFVGLIVKKGSTWKAKHPRKEGDKSWNRSTCFANSTSTSRLDSAMCPEGVVILPCLALSGGTCRKSECNCYVPASIAVVIPQRHLSGKSLKPFCLLQLYKKATENMQRSYSKKAFPWDNACMESFSQA